MISRRAFGSLLAVVTAIVCMVPVAHGQGMGPGGGRGRVYNPATETTVTGTVQQVRTVSGRAGRGWGGSHLDLRTDSGTLDVHLGPSSFLASRNFKFTKGDRIEVTGSKVTFQGHDAIIAREVKMGGKVLTLRDAQGIPEWSGRRRR